MYLNPIEEICKEFNIDSNLDVEQIIKELTKIQATIHPDVNPDFSVEDNEKFSRIEEAKKALRKNSGETRIAVSDVLEIIKSVKYQDLEVKKESETIENDIKESSKSIIKTLKQRSLPRKITVSSIWAIITLLWAFPSMISEHPILGQLINIHNFYLFLSLVWLLALMVAIIILVYAFINETYTKNILYFLQNENNQYAIFSNFLDYSNFDEHTFTNKKLEDFIFQKVFMDDRLWSDYRYIEIPKYPFSFLHPKTLHISNLVKRKKHYYSRYQFTNIPKHLYPYIIDIIPQISNVIIARAIEKGLITKKANINWFDTYFINI